LTASLGKLKSSNFHLWNSRGGRSEEFNESPGAQTDSSEWKRDHRAARKLFSGECPSGDALMRRWLRPVVYGALALLIVAAVYFVKNPPFSKEVPPRRDIPYAPPPTKAPGLSGFVNRQEAYEKRVTPDIDSKLPEVKDTQDVSAVIQVMMDTKDKDATRNEAVNLLRRSGCKDLSSRLARILWNPQEGERFRSFCVQHLWLNLPKAGETEKAEIMATLHKCLADKHLAVRREALLALVREKDAQGAELAVKWLTAPEGAEARDLAIHSIYELGLKEQIPEIRKYLADPSEPVRIAAIVVLSQWGDEASRSAIEEAAKSKSVRLQNAAQMALKRMDAAKQTQPGEPKG